MASVTPRDLGYKGMSLVTYHNAMYRQARSAFIVGSYYPALVAHAHWASAYSIT